MIEVRPFEGLRFARDPEPRIAGPYDVIAPSERDRLAEHAESVVHLTLPPGEEGARDYAAAARRLSDWERDGVLIRDAGPRLYTLREGTAAGRERRGFFAAVRLPETPGTPGTPGAAAGPGEILPHERTMAGPKLDRLLLTREVRANLEPLFFLYEDRDGELASLCESGEELARCTGPDGTALAFGATADADPIARVRAFLARGSLVIADGHHRYETMRSYRDERREQAGGRDPEAPYEFVLAYLVNAFDPGTEIRAIHRLLRGSVAPVDAALRECGFRVESLGASSSPSDLISRLAELRKGEHAFAAALPGGELLLARRARGPRLDVEVLHEELLPRLGGELGFDSRPPRALETVRAGDAALALLMNPLEPDELFRVVRAGGLLPQKSTFFSPKVPSGLVLRTL